MRKISLVLILACLLTSGCATKKIELTQSGFLGDYGQLHEDEETEGMQIYRNENIDIAGKYSKVMIAPVVIKLDPSLEDAKLSEEDEEKMSTYFYEQLQAKLEGEYELTKERGEDVMLLRTAITNLIANKVLLNLHWTTTLAGVGIGGASIEAELVDSLTGERILAFIDAKRGRRLDLREPSQLLPTYADGLTKWGHTKEALETWAEILVDNLYELKEK